MSICIILSACSPSMDQAKQALKSGDFEQAEKVLTDLKEAPENSVEAKALLSLVHFYTQSLEIALAELQEQQKTASDNPTYLSVVKEINTKLADLDQLIIENNIDKIRARLEQNPAPFIKTRLQWLLYKQSGSKDSALLEALTQSEETLFQELSLGEQAKQEPERYYDLLEKFPHSSLRNLWYQKLITVLEKKEALRDIHNLLIKWKEETHNDAPIKAEILLKQATYSLPEQKSSALNYYLTYLRMYPKHEAGRATIYKIREELSEELNAQDHLLLAQAATEQYMYQTAYSELSKSPITTAAALYRLGEYALKAKYYREAQKHFQKIQAGYRNSKEAGLAGVKLALLHRNAKAYAPALQSIQNIKETYGSQKEVIASALWEESIVYDLQNKPKERAATCLKLVTLMPTHEEAMPALWHGVWFAYQQGDYARVIQLLEQHSKNYQKHELESRFKYWLGRAYEETDDFDKARVLYQQLLKNPLLDYYTHRAKERLRVIQFGGADQYATRSYKGYKTQPRPNYVSAFEKALHGDVNAFEPINELYYLQQMQEFMPLARTSKNVNHQIMRALELHKEKKYYEAITQYRYLAETDNRYLPAAFPLAYFAKIEQETKKYGMNPFLISGLIWQESQYKKDIQSWVGATGLMQIMPSTAEHIAEKLNLAEYDLTKANDSIEMGTWYLHNRHTLFDNNSMLAVASYNAGAGPVYRWLKDFGHLDYDALAESITYPETRNYVKHVFTSYWIYQELYGKP